MAVRLAPHPTPLLWLGLRHDMGRQDNLAWVALLFYWIVAYKTVWPSGAQSTLQVFLGAIDVLYVRTIWKSSLTASMAYSQVLAFDNPSLFLTILPSHLEPVFFPSTTPRKDISSSASLKVII